MFPEDIVIGVPHQLPGKKEIDVGVDHAPKHLDISPKNGMKNYPKIFCMNWILMATYTCIDLDLIMIYTRDH
jgi:hypothetical protein